MLETVLALACLAGLLLTLLSWWAQHRLLRLPPPPLPAQLPSITILKPLRGADPGLAENLRSFFRLDYPDYELIFGVQDPDDPALGVVRRVVAEHPQVPATIVVDPRRLGPNPKVANLANMLRHAQHEAILISDSNVRVRSDYLRDLASHLDLPDVGLVTSPIRGTRGSGPGGVLEALQLNTFVMGGVALVGSVVGLPCVVGKSMLLRRADLERIGGLAYLVHYLAEDQVCGEEIHRLGLRVALSSQPVDNVLGRLGWKQFAARHLRWARIRRRINPAAYAAELLANPVALSAFAFLAVPSRGTALLALATLFACAGLAARAERRLGVSRPLVAYPILELARAVLVAALWAVPFLRSSVLWRGHRIEVGPRTFIAPPEAPAEAAAGAAPAGGGALSPRMPP